MNKTVKDQLMASLLRTIATAGGSIEESAAAINEAVSHSEQIEMEVRRLRADLKAEDFRHIEATRALRLKLDSVKKMCRHHVDEYRADPSGNSDSHYECLICGRVQ